MNTKETIRAEIERLIKNPRLDEEYNPAYQCGLRDLRAFIDSLQQEQPEPSNNLVDVDEVREDFITEVYRVLDADPTNDRANAIINAFDSLPTVSQEQPEVDLEKSVEFECIGKRVKMTIQALINYYIDSECCNVADECGF